MCSSDLDLARSLRFYVEGLGFAEFARFELERDIAEVDPPVRLTSLFIQKDGLRVELLHYRSPGAIGHPSTRRPALAGLAPHSVCRGRLGRAALLLDAGRQKQLERCVAVRLYFGGLARLASLAPLARLATPTRESLHHSGDRPGSCRACLLTTNAPA